MRISKSSSRPSLRKSPLRAIGLALGVLAPCVLALALKPAQAPRTTASSPTGSGTPTVSANVGQNPDKHSRPDGAAAANDARGGGAADSSCASCHRSQAATQPFTPMGRTLELPGENTILKEHPSLSYHRGAYSYSVKTVGDKTTYAVTDGSQTISLPVKWSMGAGGQTWVLERDGKFYESLVSFYPAIAGLDITTGDEILKPATLQEAMGRELTKEDAKACFGCHATNVLSNGNLNLSTLKPGLTCEHCHEGALLHAEDANQGSFDTTPPKLSALSSEHISDFCGRCHRTWEMVVRNHWQGPLNVRFPAYRIANSRCFNGADPRISCIACHDPHRDVVTDKTAYDSKCLACHAPAISAVKVAPVSAVAATGGAGAGAHEKPKVCPVAKSDCVSCHMPKVVFPGGGGHLTFTDHDIRVVKAGDVYPN